MVIFDTNVLISAALISGSKADAAVRLVLDRQLPLVFSDATFSELVPACRNWREFLQAGTGRGIDAEQV